jgi:hypothetical protein
MVEMINGQAAATPITPLFAVSWMIPFIRAFSAAEKAVWQVMRKLFVTGGAGGGVPTVFIRMVTL